MNQHPSSLPQLEANLIKCDLTSRDIVSASTFSRNDYGQSTQPIYVWDELRRVEKLREYGVMHTQTEPAFDRIVDLVRRYFAVPIVAINFLDDKEMFSKACFGLEQRVMPKDLSFCATTIAQTDIICIPDTFNVPTLANHPFVCGDTPIRFYSGVPIVVYNSHNEAFVIGALCIADMRPQVELGDNERQVLRQFSAMITDTLELRLQQHNTAKAAELKSAFLANMSHEIRTPMSGIIGILDLLKQTKLSHSQEKYLEHIRSANEHLLNIVSDILDLSKVESGKMRFERIPVDLKKLCEQVIGIFVASAKDKCVELSLYYEDDTARYVMTDPVRVRQILSNLINNAIKFTPKGGAVTVRAFKCCGDCEVKLQVSDTGIGIKPEAQAVIFDAYNQADKFTHRIYGGTGLGLSVCKALAEGMHGTISVESEQGKGSTFSLCLPLEPVDEAILKTWHNEHDHNSWQLPRKTAHILLAEDNELNAMVAKKSLKKFGYEVTHAKDGQEAVNLFTQSPNKYQIILMDHQMPIMDGVQATKVLKKRFSSLPPIIAVTAHAMHGDKDVYIEAGMQDYCTKPYKPETLDSMIQHWLHQPVVA
ncbi:MULTISPECIES: ATP-binding protein [unclassified Moraxella]|uniref:GAF domain-containing hybrid sensor histidine kinase/response regulator n=1 Tax=unclassified Moraxella TaxID=2685852 RepID=UPI003AF5FE9D